MAPAATGVLHLVETEDFPRYSSYWGPTGILSPDGEHLYVAASVDNLDAIVVLRRNDGSCRSGPRTLCLSDNRFRIELDWRGSAGIGAGPATTRVGDSTSAIVGVSAPKYRAFVGRSGR